MLSILLGAKDVVADSREAIAIQYRSARELGLACRERGACKAQG